jgi:ankyrin repeat protein
MSTLGIRFIGPRAVAFIGLLLGAVMTHAATGVASAARGADAKAVRAELAAGADANVPETDGTTALLWAAYHADPDMASVLLKAGADPNAANHFGVTPLLQASRNGDSATMRVLLAGGATLSRAERDGETPLMAAARSGNTEAIRLLLDAGADVNAADALQQETALMWATAEGHEAAVDMLLKAGADPNRKARVNELTQRSPRADFPTGGFTALMWAARNGNDAIVHRLIEAGADVRATNGDGASPMMLAIVNDRFDMAAELLKLGADANDGSLYYAVEMRDAPTDWRARDGSRLRAEHPNKLTALDLVGKLLEAGADPNKPFTGQMHSSSMCCDDKGSGTPFYRAAVAADVESMKLMIARGADVEWAPKAAEGPPPLPFADKTGLTPLMVAVNGGKGLLMAGGPGDIREGAIGIFREPGNRNPADAVRLLLAAGAKPNVKSPKGDTALHIAAHDGRLEAIRALVEGGASVEQKNAQGLTALQVVEKMGTRKLDPIAEMIGIIDDGAQPKETAAFLKQLVAERAARKQ